MIETNPKFRIGDKVYITGNTNIAFNSFVADKDWDMVIEAAVIAIDSITFREEKPVIRYKLKDVFYTVDEEDIYLTKDEALQATKDLFPRYLKGTIYQNNQELRNIAHEISNYLQNKKAEIDELNSSNKELERKLNDLTGEKK